MSKKPHARARIDNSLTDLVAAVQIQATGGSALSSYGTISYANNYALITLNRIILTYLFAGNGIFQTAIQLPIQDGIAKGIKIESGEMSPEDVDIILDWFEEYDIWSLILNAKTWARLYGGSAIIVNCDQDPEKPLNMKRLKNAPIEFYDVDRWELSISGTGAHDFLSFDDMTKSDELYLNGQKLDRSHVIMLTGKRAPSYVRRQLRGWGMSEAERMLRDLNNYLKTQDVLYEILDESKIDVYKIDGLANKLLTVGGTAAIQKRIQAANEIKNYVNALILDQKEEYEQKTLTFAGLADVMRENRIGVASAFRMPMTKLFGLSASGFSTGEEDLENYNQMVESEIQASIRPVVRELIKIACANLFGYVPDFRFSFPPLRVLPELEREQINASKIERMLALYDRGLVTDGKKIADELAKEEVISAELSAAFEQRPIPPNGSESVEPSQISVFRNPENGGHKA